MSAVMDRLHKAVADAMQEIDADFLRHRAAKSWHFMISATGGNGWTANSVRALRVEYTLSDQLSEGVKAAYPSGILEELHRRELFIKVQQDLAAPRLARDVTDQGLVIGGAEPPTEPSIPKPGKIWF